MSNPNKKAISVPGVAPSPIFSPVVESGHLVYLAGQVGVGKDGKYVQGTIKDRTLAILDRVKDKLQPVGLDLSDVVSVQIFLSKYEQDFTNMNEAYIEGFKGTGDLPVRTCVGVAALPAGTDIEMTFIAAKRESAAKL